MKDSRWEINMQIHEAFKVCEKRIVYLYKKYGEYQFTLHSSLLDAMEKAFDHRYILGEDIIEIIEIADYDNMTWYRYNDIKEYWEDNYMQ